MKLRHFFLVVLLTSFAQAKTAKVRQSGTLIQMDSVQCGSDQASSKSLTGEILGTDSGHKMTRVLLCPEYSSVRPKPLPDPPEGREASGTLAGWCAGTVLDRQGPDKASRCGIGR